LVVGGYGCFGSHGKEEKNVRRKECGKLGKRMKQRWGDECEVCIYIDEK